jgi:hypothetical protein
MHRKARRHGYRNLHFAAFLAVALSAPGVGSAHHALEPFYETGTELETMAMLAKIDWINPHAWLRFDFVFPNGVVEKNVLLETVGIAGLRQLGIVRDSLKVGTMYRINYHPKVDGTPGGFMTKLVRPDGSMLGEPGYDPNDELL